MLVRGDPPDDFADNLRSLGLIDIAELVCDGVRLRKHIPRHIEERFNIVEAYTQFEPYLCYIVQGYEMPTTTDEIWATGLWAGSLVEKELEHTNLMLRAIWGHWDAAKEEAQQWYDCCRRTAQENAELKARIEIMSGQGSNCD